MGHPYRQRHQDTAQTSTETGYMKATSTTDNATTKPKPTNGRRKKQA